MKSKNSSELEPEEWVPRPSPEDIQALRAGRLRKEEDLLLRIDDLSAQLQFPTLRQRQGTSAGWPPFEL